MRTTALILAAILVAIGFTLWMCAHYVLAILEPFDLIPHTSTISHVSFVTEQPRNDFTPSGGELTPISCYTGVERHGAVGREDGVSVATYRYPIGTWVWIEGFGERRVDTVTASEYSDRIDVWFGYDYDACIKFGVQWREVKILS